MFLSCVIGNVIYVLNALFLSLGALTLVFELSVVTVKLNDVPYLIVLKVRLKDRTMLHNV